MLLTSLFIIHFLKYHLQKLKCDLVNNIDSQLQELMDEFVQRFDDTNKDSEASESLFKEKQKYKFNLLA